MRTPPILVIASNTMHMHAPFVRHSNCRTTMTISSFLPHCIAPRSIFLATSHYSTAQLLNCSTAQLLNCSTAQLLNCSTAQLPYHTPKECENEE
eukprot:scaffold44805_cov85-Attheya_sp.AAC.1